MRFRIAIILLLLLGLQASYGQVLNTIDKVKLDLPCKLNLVYNQDGKKSYSCQTILNDTPVSYRITIDDLTNSFRGLEVSERKSWVKNYLDRIRKGVQPESKNVKNRVAFNIRAVQFDDTFNLGDTILKGRTLVFVYRSKSISFNFVSSLPGFDSRFETFLTKVKLID
jgi:hypothetical protein